MPLANLEILPIGLVRARHIERAVAEGSIERAEALAARVGSELESLRDALGALGPIASAAAAREQ